MYISTAKPRNSLFLVATLRMFVHAHYYKHYAVHNYLKHHLYMSMQKSELFLSLKAELK